MAVTASALAAPAEESFTEPTHDKPTHDKPTLDSSTSDKPTSDEPANGEPRSETGDLRRVPVPLCDPPFEDETTDAFNTATTAAATAATAIGGCGSGAQETLALAFALPSGLPVSPVDPTGLSRGTHRRLQLVPPLESKPARRSAKRKRTPEDDFGPRHTPRANLPEPRPWAGRLVQAIVEVTSGVRPVSQLVRWTTTDVYATMQRRIAHTELLSQRASSGQRVGAIVRSIHVDEPSDGVAEVCAVVQHGVRCRAIALRLEGFDGRWQCTALQVG